MALNKALYQGTNFMRNLVTATELGTLNPQEPTSAWASSWAEAGSQWAVGATSRCCVVLI